MYMQVYKIVRLVVIIFTSSYFLGIIWHIYAVDIQETTFVDGFPVEQNFRTVKLKHDEKMEDTNLERLIKVWYFAITTLSTIGYGDFAPVSTNERLIVSFILLFGVAIFSFIMG